MNISRKPVKVVIYYNDGTYEELSNNYFPTNPWPSSPNTFSNTCKECGLKLEGTMGYVCSNPKCPTGLGPIMCGVNNE